MMTASSTPNGPRKHDANEKELLVRHAGERRRVECAQQNEQVALGMLPKTQHLSAEQIDLVVKHAQEWAALGIDKNNEECAMQEKYVKLRAELEARQKIEAAALVQQG